MEEHESIAVTVIGGYLGAGKTTLVNRILRGAPSGTAVLVNDFGSVDIDTDLIEAESDQDGVVSLANGCICCTITDGLVGALETIRNYRPRPARLVIEASGVSLPGEIAAYASLPGFALDAVVVVADAEQVRRQARDRYVGDVVLDQLAAADLLLLNKADLVDPGQLDSLTAWIAGIAPSATVLAGERGEVPLEVVLGRAERAADVAPPDGHDHAHADALFDTWSFTTAALLDAERVDGALAALPADVVRVKGIVQTVQRPDRRTVIHRVGPRSESSDGGPWGDQESRVVAIGRPGSIDEHWLEEHFGPETERSRR